MLAPGSADAVALLDGELAGAGKHAERLLAEVVAAVRPGGLIAVAVPGPLTGGPDRRFTSAELSTALGHRGLAMELLAAPGAAARVRGGARRLGDEVLDRSPGLLDAGDALVGVARTPIDERGRSAAFFASLPRKIVAAAVLCRDGSERLLVVYDRFRGHWTIPGGVVDADEDPRSGAVREAYEEAGLRVEAGALLGVFSASFPDRVVFVYDARPLDLDATPAPLHTHEIGEAAWVDLDEGLARVAGYVREQLLRCLESPGGTWRQ